MVEWIRACVPAAMQSLGDALAGLIDAAAVKPHGRPQRLEPTLSDCLARRIHHLIGARINGNGSRAVAIDKLLNFLGNLVHRGRTRYRLARAVSSALHRP